MAEDLAHLVTSQDNGNAPAPLAVDEILELTTTPGRTEWAGPELGSQPAVDARVDAVRGPSLLRRALPGFYSDPSVARVEAAVGASGRVEVTSRYENQCEPA